MEGTGAIHIRQLVINALRMRPDRIIVGEVRSEEALDMLQAMNTGHDGSLTTLHANTPRDGLGRLEVMVGMANANMGIRSIRAQIASAVDLFVQTSRFSDGTRRITHITEVVGMEQDIITLQDIFLFEKTGITENGRVRGRFRATGIRPKFYDRLKTCGITLAHADVPDGGGDQLAPPRIAPNHAPYAVGVGQKSQASGFKTGRGTATAYRARLLPPDTRRATSPGQFRTT